MQYDVITLVKKFVCILSGDGRQNSLLERKKGKKSGNILQPGARRRNQKQVSCAKRWKTVYF